MMPQLVILMRSTFLRASFLTVALGAALSAHGQFYKTTSLSYSQLSLVITPLPDGNNLWTTTVNVTNTTVAPVRVYDVTTGLLLDGSPSNWDNAASAWTLGSKVSQSVNEAFHLSMDRSVTDVPLDPAHGVTSSVSLDAFGVGDLNPGQSTVYTRQREITPNVSNISTGFVYVTTPVPEPAPLAALGLGAFGFLRRRRRS